MLVLIWVQTVCKGYRQVAEFSIGLLIVILSTLQVNILLFKVLCHIGRFYHNYLDTTLNAFYMLYVSNQQK